MNTAHLDMITKGKTWWRSFRLTEKKSKVNGKTLLTLRKRDTESFLKAEKIDFAEFQRKAYGGNFFAGPMSLFNPGFFK